VTSVLGLQSAADPVQPLDARPVDGHAPHTAFVLAKRQREFIERMIREGCYNRESEVRRAALRRPEEEESDYLTPPALTASQVGRIFVLAIIQSHGWNAL
jgi:putative addiction module CopG family antidote